MNEGIKDEGRGGGGLGVRGNVAFWKARENSDQPITDI